MANTITDEASQRNANELANAIRAQRILETREIMATPSGRRFMCRWLERCGVFMLCYDPGSARNTDFNLGQRNIGLALMADLEEAGMDYYVAMLRERQVANTGAENAPP
jgi:hypothetical protein